GDVVVEVIVRLADVRLDGTGAFHDRGSPLIGVAADESVEVLEAEARRPEVERSRLARLPIRNVVILAEPRRVPAVLTEELGDAGRVFPHQGVIAGKSGACFHDDAGMNGVVIAPREERGPRRRTQCCRVELVIAETLRGETVERGCGGRSSKRTRGAEAHIVQENEENVRRALTGPTPPRKGRLSCL